MADYFFAEKTCCPADPECLPLAHPVLMYEHDMRKIGVSPVLVKEDPKPGSDDFPDFQIREHAAEAVFFSFPDFEGVREQIDEEASYALAAQAEYEKIATNKRRLEHLLEKMQVKTQQALPVVEPEICSRLANSRRRKAGSQPTKVGMSASRCFHRVRK